MSASGLGPVQGVWRHRRFVLGMVKREFQARYMGSLLGATWAVLGPLTTIFIYTVVFGRIMKARVPGVEDGLGYGVFLCAGVLPWTLFTETITRCVSIFVDEANLLKKMSFPRASLPAIVLLSAVSNFVIVSGLLLAVLFVSGRPPGWTLLGVLPLLVVQQGLALGIGVTLGIVHVFFRDVAHATTIVLQLWFWLTPIVYPMRILPEGLRTALFLNPMAGLVNGYQDALVRGRLPDLPTLIVPVLAAAGTLLLARRTFRGLAGDMVDEL